MTQRVIQIVLDSTGVRRGTRDIETQLGRVDKKAKTTSRSFGALRQVIGGLFTGAAVVGLTRQADAYTNLNNRIRLVTDSQSEANTVFNELITVANDTRSSLQSTVELYGRVARSLDQINASQQEAVDLTKLVNQTFLISGATAQEAAASTIQFAQGLASGALRGDELRSVLEGNQRLSIALADSFGVTVGELRELGAAGKLNVKEFLPGLLAQAEAINDEFERTTPTLQQTFTTLRNFATVAIGAFNETAGVTAGLVDIFSLTSEEIVELKTTLEDAGLAFREFVEVATVAVVNFAEQLAPRFETVRTEIVKIIAALTRDEDLFREAFAGQGEAADSIEVIKNKLIEELDAIQRTNDARREEIELRRVQADLTKKDAGKRGSTFEIDEKALEDLEALKQSLVESNEALQAAATGAVTYEDALQAIEIRTLAAAAGNGALAAEIFALIDANDALEASQQAAADAVDRAAEILEDTRTPLENYIAGIREAQDLFKRGFIDEETLQRQVAVLAEELADGEKVIDDFARRARENIQDALAGFFSEGFKDIDEFGRRFLQMILEIQSQALAANILEALLGSEGVGGGGLGAFLGGLFGGARAQGGPVNPNQAFMVGESGPELFIPPSQGKIAPASQSAPNVNVAGPTIVNTIDPNEVVAAGLEANGTAIINMIGTHRAAVRQAMGI